LELAEGFKVREFVEVLEAGGDGVEAGRDEALDSFDWEGAATDDVSETDIGFLNPFRKDSTPGCLTHS
jgi:hypothetical protein